MTSIVIFFFFNDTATTEIYTLSLHDALPIFFFQIKTIQFLHVYLSTGNYQVQESLCYGAPAATKGVAIEGEVNFSTTHMSSKKHLCKFNTAFSN